MWHIKYMARSVSFHKKLTGKTRQYIERTTRQICVVANGSGLHNAVSPFKSTRSIIVCGKKFLLKDIFILFFSLLLLISMHLRIIFSDIKNMPWLDKIV